MEASVTPQLLTVIEKDKLKAWPPSEWAKWRIERKEDGARLLCVDGVFQSRTGKPLNNLGYIARELGNLAKGMVFDGELRGKDWADTMHLARAGEGERDGSGLTFFVFDLLSIHEWKVGECLVPLDQRLECLRAYLPDSEHVKVVKGLKGLNYLDFKILHDLHLMTGCDGTVLKRLDSLYEFKRTKTWLKVKPVRDYDVVVTGMVEGKGKYKGMCGALLFIRPNGAEGKVSGMTDEQRKAWWKAEDSIVGKTIEVAARGLHPSGALIEPRFIRIREDK